MSNGLRCPEEPGIAVFNSRHWRSVAEGDGEDVHEGGVRGHYQDRGLVPAGLLAEDVDSEAQDPEGNEPTDGPHAVLEHSPPADMGSEVSHLQQGLDRGEGKGLKSYLRLREQESQA